MTLLACIPIAGSVTLAEVAAASLSTADNTYQLDSNINVVFEDDGGTDILTLYESDRGVQAHAHAAIGAQAGINGGSLNFGFSQVILDIEEIFTGTVDYHAGGAIYLEIDPTNDFAFAIGNDIYIATKSGNIRTGMSMYGLQFAVEHGGDGDAGFLYGLIGSTYLRGGGDITHAVGGNVGVTVTGTGEMIDGVGLEISTPFIVNGSIRNLQGLVVFDQIGATSTNKAIETNAGHVVFNEGSDDDTDFRVEGATNTHLLFTDGSADRIGINDSTPDGKLDIVQSDASAGIPVIELEQLDLSEEFFNFVGTAATGNPIEAISSKTFTPTHLIRAAVNGSFGYFLFGTAA